MVSARKFKCPFPFVVFHLYQLVSSSSIIILFYYIFVSRWNHTSVNITRWIGLELEVHPTTRDYVN